MGLWGTPAAAWAVGGWDGTILELQNGVFAIVSLGNTASFNAAWGFGAGDVWAVGSNIMHYDGTGWTAVVASTTAAVGDGTGTTGNTDTMNGVWGAASNDVWAVGTDGDALHWDGSSWTFSNIGTEAAARTRRPSGGPRRTDIWVVTNCHAGETPDVVHWNGTSWTVTVLDPSVTQNYLYCRLDRRPRRRLGRRRRRRDRPLRRNEPGLPSSRATAPCRRSSASGAAGRTTSGPPERQGRSCTGTERRGPGKPTRATT